LFAVAAPSIVIFSTPFSLLFTPELAFDESTLSAAMAVKGKVQKSKDRIV
jgi:hypothetical protein